MSRRPANKVSLAVSVFVAAALWSAGARPALAATGDPDTEHDQCVASAEKDPEAALAQAKQWSNQGGGLLADHCAAMALYDMKHYREAAQAFERLAQTMTDQDPAGRARLYDQAGQAWLVADQPGRALGDFESALRLAPNDPDLLIDRAEALADAKKYWDAIDDLNRASDLAPQKAEIYAYRAAAYRAVDSLDLARDDVEHNLRLAPDNPIGLLERGNIRRIEGDVAGARKDWLSVERIAPDSPSAGAASRNLARLGAREPKPDAKPAGNGPS
jgi:tetratricopeptide (TPR) repeat protein